MPGIDDLVEIGRGGAGVVYRGRQRDLQRDVAVKVVWSWGTPEADLSRWRREVTAMARLSNHPNILAVYDGGTTPEGLPYLVMPYVPDGSLGDRVRRKGPLPPTEVAELGRRLAGALAAAHASGVLHRDVKPDNVLLSPYGEPQLADFGIARLLDATSTATTNVHATVAYAAPEVLSGSPADEASDVYGLGATLHACLTGKAPYVARDGEPLVALAVRITREPPADLRAAGVPGPLAAVVEEAMARDVDARIPSAAELARRLEAANGSEAERGPAATVPAPVTRVLAPLQPATPPPAAPVPRRRSYGPAIAAVLLAVLGGAAALLFMRADEGDPDASSTTPEPSSTEVPGPTGGETTRATDAAPAAPAGTGGDVGEAAVRYFDAIAAGELDRAYAMTTPGFRAAQPYEGFGEFWGGFGTVALAGSPSVDDDSLTATVDLRLDDRTEAYTLSFVRTDDGTLLVDGPRPR